MRRSVPALLGALLLILAVAAPRAEAIRNHPKKPAPYGILGIGWGQHIGSVPNLRIEAGDGFVNYYHRPGERVIFGEAQVRDVFYGFYDNRFFIAIMPFEGHTIFRRLIQAFTDIYGQADLEDDYDKRYLWRWEHVELELTWSQRSGEGRAVFQFLPIVWEMRRDEMLRGPSE